MIRRTTLLCLLLLTLTGMILSASTLQERVSLSVKDAKQEDVANLLSDILGRHIQFQSFDATESISFEFKDASVKSVLQQLSRYGRIVAPGYDLGVSCYDSFAPATVLGKRITLDLKTWESAQLSREISAAAGMEIRFNSTNSEELSMEARDVPLRVLLDQLSELGSITIAGQPVDCNGAPQSSK